MERVSLGRPRWLTAVIWLALLPVLIAGAWGGWLFLRWSTAGVRPGAWRDILCWALPMALGFAAMMLAPACLLSARRSSRLALGLGIALAAYAVVAWQIGRQFDLKPPIVGIFTGLYTLLVFLSILDLYRPTVPRRGFLPMTTTRGDRVFLAILFLVAATIAWLIFFPELSYWWVVAAVTAAAAVILRWG